MRSPDLRVTNRSQIGRPLSTYEQLRLRWEWLDEEIARARRPARAVGAGHCCPALRTRQRIAGSRAPPTGDVVFVPSLRRASDRPGALSPTIAARLWSRARLGGRWLFAPMLERPVRDTVVLMAKGETARPDCDAT